MSEPNDSWARTVGLFESALQVPEPDREDWLRDQCGGDTRLFSEVISLLAASLAEEAATEVALQDAASLLHIEGRHYGAWKALRVLGTGGMGSVLLVERADGQFHQQAALKLVASHLVGEYFLERLRSERQILASLNHPNITKLLDGGVTEDGAPYLVMEYVEGGVPLDEYADSLHLTISQRLELFLKICDPIEFAHRNLVVHRDLKPSNILIEPGGAPKLLDFGTARILPEAGGSVTTTLHRFITPRYASPEALQHGPITTQTDVFSLGVILFELLTGSWPFGEASSAHLTIHQIAGGVVAAPEARVTADVAAARSSTVRNLRRILSGELGSVLRKSVEAGADRRYTSVADLAQDVRSYLGGLPVRARKPSRWYRTSKFVGRHVAAVVIASLTVVALLGMGGYAFWQQRSALVEAERARTVNRFLTAVFSLADAGDAGGINQTVPQLLQSAEQYIEPSLGRDLAVSSDVHAMLANGFLSQGQFAKSLELLQKSFQEAQHVKDTARVAVTLVRLGAETYGTGLGTGAVQKADQGLAMYRQNRRVFTPEQQFEVLLTAGTLHLYYREDDAAYLPMLEEAVRIARANPERMNALQRASSLAMLATAYTDQHRYQEAEPLFREALALDRAAPFHNNALALHLQFFARLSRFTKRYDEGEKAQREALELSVKQLGPDAPSSATQRARWAYTLTESANFEQASQQAAQALRSMRKLYPAGSFQLWTQLATAAYTSALVGQYREAEGLAREALQAIGPNPSVTDARWQETRGYLALALVGQGKYDEARPLLEQTTRFYAAGKKESPYRDRLNDALKKVAR